MEYITSKANVKEEIVDLPDLEIKNEPEDPLDICTAISDLPSTSYTLKNTEEKSQQKCSYQPKWSIKKSDLDNANTDSCMPSLQDLLPSNVVAVPTVHQSVNIANRVWLNQPNTFGKENGEQNTTTNILLPNGQNFFSLPVVVRMVNPRMHQFTQNPSVVQDINRNPGLFFKNTNNTVKTCGDKNLAQGLSNKPSMQDFQIRTEMPSKTTSLISGPRKRIRTSSECVDLEVLDKKIDNKIQKLVNQITKNKNRKLSIELSNELIYAIYDIKSEVNNMRIGYRNENTKLMSEIKTLNSSNNEMLQSE